jgi:hypothetical protein
MENVGLVPHYRQQFDRVIRATWFATLLDRCAEGNWPPLRFLRRQGGRRMNETRPRKDKGALSYSVVPNSRA